MSARWAAVLAIGLCAGAAWLEARASSAAALRAGRPVWGMAALRYEGQPPVVPPALYLVLHDPSRGSLDLVLLPAGTPRAGTGPKPGTLADVYGESLRAGADPGGAGRLMAGAAAAAVGGTPGWPADAPAPLFTAALTLDAAARPGSPGEARRRLSRAAGDPFLWLRAPAFLSRLARGSDGLGAWDAASLIRALRGLEPGSVRAARWPAPELAGPFVAHLFSGAGAGDRRGVVTVEVLNAAGAPGVALRATKVLRWAGFDVVNFGNAAAPEAATAAVDRVGRPEAARAVLAALGCAGAESLTAFEPSPLTMVSLTIGRDVSGCRRLAGADGRAQED